MINKKLRNAIIYIVSGVACALFGATVALSLYTPHTSYEKAKETQSTTEDEKPLLELVDSAMKSPTANGLLLPYELGKLDYVEIYEAHELTVDMLTSREEDTVIIEYFDMTVESGRDKEYRLSSGFNEPVNYYVTYDHIEGLERFDRLITYFVYDNTTQFEDDIWMRYDYMMNREKLKYELVYAGDAF